ncbi:glycosyltransferase family 4 protein [Salinimonas marina]|uniref:Glycosyltransferase family 4 protein n=1 Tax=Salinimonas marina TaxID=2785918 RepID=A0A7S9DXL6_9ALTE|nr:glycosyltransferase family 4 protein [Salinimonas marina]QPG05140.1 glycosyltransferase family 4 protein [Salinimonas marina]
MKEGKAIRIDVYHNILWAGYKNKVFENLFKKATNFDVKVSVIQIARSEIIRKGMEQDSFKGINYPYELLFDDYYEDVPKLKKVIKLVNKIYKSNANIVILPGYHKLEYWFMLFAAFVKRQSIYVFCDSTELDKPEVLIKEIAKKIFFLFVNGVFAYGEASARYISKYISKDKITYPISAAVEFDTGLDKREVIKRKSEGLYNRKNLLYVGRISKEKNLASLMSWCKTNTYFENNWRLVVVGEGDERASLEKQYSSENIVFKGARKQKEIAECLLDATILILPSTSEPWGLVVNEAYYNYCPAIISTYCGCYLDLVIKEEKQSLNPCNMEKLETKLKLITASKVDYEELCVAVRNKIEYYSPGKAAERILTRVLSEE